MRTSNALKQLRLSPCASQRVASAPSLRACRHLKNACPLHSSLRGRKQRLHRTSSRARRGTRAAVVERPQRCSNSRRLTAQAASHSSNAGAGDALKPRALRPLDSHSKIVVVGTGWGAARFVQDLDPKFKNTSVVSPRDHMLFTPLLASTAVGTLEHRSVLQPVRDQLNQKGFTFHQAKLVGLDLSRGVVHCHSVIEAGAVDVERKFDLPFDELVIAVGARASTFGIPGVREHAFFLKEARHGRAIRRRLIGCFEAASLPDVSEEEQRDLLRFVVVGGGPTGVELAGEISDFINQDLARVYPRCVGKASIVLYEASGSILTSFDEYLAEYALHKLRKGKLCDVKLGARVREVLRHAVVVQEANEDEPREVPCGAVMWSTGVGPIDLVQTRLTDLPKHERTGNILVDKFLRVKGHPNMFALGDCATIEDQPLAAIAQVAEMSGKYVAEQFNTHTTGTSSSDPGAPFQFASKGVMANLGGYRAVATLGGEATSEIAMNLRGFSAWLTWRATYMSKLGSWRNRLQVPFDWFKTFFFGRDTARF